MPRSRPAPQPSPRPHLPSANRARHAAITDLIAICGCRLCEIGTLTLADWTAPGGLLALSGPAQKSADHSIETPLVGDQERGEVAAWPGGPRAPAARLSRAAARRRTLRRDN